jgi:choline dehydrogenase-like flavoprotein
MAWASCPLTRRPCSHVEVAKSLGLPFVHDLNNPRAPINGLFNIDLMISAAGFRQSTYSAYLPKPLALERMSRLTICSGVVASKLDVGEDGVVRGVHVIDHLARGTSREYYVKANREVVVCCGSIYTPQLLLLRYVGLFCA